MTGFALLLVAFGIVCILIVNGGNRFDDED